MHTLYLNKAKELLETISPEQIDVADRLRLAEVLLKLHRLESRVVRGNGAAVEMFSSELTKETAVALFLAEHFEGEGAHGGYVEVEATALFAAYEAWCRKRGEPPMTAPVFGKALRAHKAFLGKRRPRAAHGGREYVLRFKADKLGLDTSACYLYNM